METSKVKEVINPEIKTGYGKNGKQWKQALVELENGVQTRLFQPIDVGMEVESFKNGEFTNWRRPDRRPQTGGGIDQVTRDQLDRIEKKLDQLLGMDEPTPEPQSGYDQARQQAEAIKQRAYNDDDRFPSEPPEGSY